MNVCILTWEYPPRIIGGVARHCKSLAKSLGKNGWQPNVITLAHPGAPRYAESEGVKVTRIDPPNYSDFLTWTLLYNQMMANMAISLHRKERFDLIHAHDWMTFIAASTIKHALGIPMVATFHSTERGRRGGLPTSFERMINDIEWLGSYEAKHVIAVSNATKQELTGKLNVPKEKVNVILNGMDFERNKIVDGVRSRFASPGERIVLFVGRLVWEKGVSNLVEAAPLILKEHPEAKLVIVGEGGMQEQLRSRASSLDISHKIYITGYLTDEILRSLYQCADVLVVPSLYEPFGFTALEGMAYGLPVVAARAGGLNEIITGGKDGLLVPPGDASSIADAVNRLLGDSKLAEMISRNGESRAKFFSSARMAVETIKVYEKAIGIHPIVKMATRRN